MGGQSIDHAAVGRRVPGIECPGRGRPRALALSDPAEKSFLRRWRIAQKARRAVSDSWRHARQERGFERFVDYAHTPDAIETVLLALRPHVAGKLSIAFGCGGDRDAASSR